MSRLRPILIIMAAACLAHAPLPASAQGREPAKITFFIWAGSNQGIVPMEVIEAYRRANPRVTIEVLESNNMITYPRMVASKRTTPDNPIVHCGFSTWIPSSRATWRACGRRWTRPPSRT